MPSASSLMLLIMMHLAHTNNWCCVCAVQGKLENAEGACRQAANSVAKPQFARLAANAWVVCCGAAHVAAVHSGQKSR